jgi:hypothetical protein
MLSADLGFNYRDVSGIKVPYRRRVYPRGANNERVPEPVLISTDVIHISFHP